MLNMKGDNMYLLNSLLLTSDKETIKKVYLYVYNFICQDDIEDIETLELINGEIPTNEAFIQKLFYTIIDEDSETLYGQIISIYQQIFTFYFIGDNMQLIELNRSIREAKASYEMAKTEKEAYYYKTMLQDLRNEKRDLMNKFNKRC